MNKAELRKLFAEKRRALSAAEVGQLSARIADRAFDEINIAKARTVHCFVSMTDRNEVDTSLIFNRLWSDHPSVRTVAPRMNKETGELEHILYPEGGDLIANRWGILEPAGSEKADPQEIDLVIVPLLCFDRKGFRVGYGKGYYDRFLRQCRQDCLKAGVSFFLPVDAIDDVHDGDFPVDLCITPERLVLPE